VGRLRGVCYGRLQDCNWFLQYRELFLGGLAVAAVNDIMMKRCSRHYSSVSALEICKRVHRPEVSAQPCQAHCRAYYYVFQGTCDLMFFIPQIPLLRISI